jgi:hypothetical protein
MKHITEMDPNEFKQTLGKENFLRVNNNLNEKEIGLLKDVLSNLNGGYIEVIRVGENRILYDVYKHGKRTATEAIQDNYRRILDTKKYP